jgi:Ser/Thr protein kinase RdoA (MazF antagonist)
MASVPAVKTVLSAEGLGRPVEGAYDIGPVRDCRFLKLGLNDSYVVSADGKRYVLRVYQYGWRTEADVRWEMDVLPRCRAAGVAVAAPIARSDSEFVWSVTAPEGSVSSRFSSTRRGAR